MKLPRLQRTWDALGRTDPFWAVLTDPERRGNRWTEDEFYRTGAEDVERLMRRLAHFSVPAQRLSALDFGCGVGRITIPLAGHFPEVIGVDIAPAMLDRARQHDATGACRFLLNAADDLALFPDARFDLVYCRLVLQHVAPQYARNYIREFVRVSRPDGAVVFQLPTPALDRVPARRTARLLPGALIRLGRRVKWGLGRVVRGAAHPVIEDHGLRLDETIDLVQRSGARVIDVAADWSHGTDRPGYEYLVSRKT